MDAIGGYFELELRKGEHYHKNALFLNTARNCFEYILLARKYKKVYMPYYTCEVMFQPLHKLGVEYEFYHINGSYEIIDLPQLKDGEAILYTNYFALKQRYITRLVEIYNDRLIVDNAQAFYAEPVKGIDTFYSARKFFGVPDGGYLYTDCLLQGIIDEDKSIPRTHHLLLRIESGPESGYKFFREADDSLDNRPVMQMSKITDSILRNIDYEWVAKRRRDNYECLRKEFGGYDMDDAVPMVFPFHLKGDVDLRGVLARDRVYVAKYWPNIDIMSLLPEERIMVDNVLPLPIDQRYVNDDMYYLINLIKNVLKY